MEYHSADLLSSTDYSLFSVDSSFNSFNSYNIYYAYFIFSWILLSLSDNYFSSPYYLIFYYNYYNYNMNSTSKSVAFILLST